MGRKKHGFKLEGVWLQRIIEQLDGIEYGTVQITIHNGNIVQVDRTVRTRFEQRKKADDQEDGTTIQN